jgi:hypothetical protein
MADSMNEEDEERHSLDYFVWKVKITQAKAVVVQIN